MRGDRKRSGRVLRVVVGSSKGALPVLVAAGFVPAGCGQAEGGGPGRFVPDGAAGSAVDAATGIGGVGGSMVGGSSGVGGSLGATGGVGGGTGGGGGSIIVTGGTGGGVGGSVATGGTGGSDFCRYGYLEEYIVDVPPDGVPADPGQICAVAVDPVTSNRAAHVTLDIDPTDATRGTGFIEVDPSLEGRVVGVPTIEIVDDPFGIASALTVSSIAQVAGGFSFVADWGSPNLRSGYRITVRVSLELSCGSDGGGTRIVHAATDLHVCDDDTGAPTWVSSGDRCVVCQVIAEMAPSPIVPDKGADGLPLAQALRLRIVELARVGNTVVLLAENDGGDDLEYEWHPSVGTLRRLDADVVAWTLGDGMADPQIQAAVWSESAAAVASWAWNEVS